MKCGKIATYRYTWPGHDERVACDDHTAMVKGVADVMGFHLQLVPIPPVDGVVCTMESKLKGKES